MSLTGYTIEENLVDKKERQFFEYVYDIVQKDKSYYFVSESFEEYFFIIKDTIAFYEKIEEYEKCAILKRNLDSYLEKIPKNTSEAIEFLVRMTPKEKMADFAILDTYSFAMDLHSSVGKRIIDIWLLRETESPLRKYYSENHQMSNRDMIANDILTKFIETVKSKNEDYGRLLP